MAINPVPIRMTAEEIIAKNKSNLREKLAMRRENVPTDLSKEIMLDKKLNSI